MIAPPRVLSQIGIVVLEPYLEGAERMNRALYGINFHHIDYPAICPFDRFAYLIEGAALMTPLINYIVWLCMQTFGHPERLHAPLSRRA